MADPEIVRKLTGLTIFGVRIEGLEGEGKEKVVFRATRLDNGEQVVMKLYQSNPMFLLNEVNFEFLPPFGDAALITERYVGIAEKLISACERTSPGLFFWHMQYVYARIMTALCLDFEEYKMPVLDTTTQTFQNSELVDLGRQTLNRKSNLRFSELEEWEYYLKEDALREVVKFISSTPFGHALNFNLPTSLLALIFCEGFFGDIPRESGNSFKALLDENPSKALAEDRLREFLEAVGLGELDPSIHEELHTLQQALDDLRTLLQSDMFDDSAWLKETGNDFMTKYNAGRNTLLRGLPRYLRTLQAYLTESG